MNQARNGRERGWDGGRRGGGEGGRVEGWEWSCQVAANAEKSTGALCVYINMMKLYLPVR